MLVIAMATFAFPVQGAFALDDPTNSDKELICHNLTGPPSPSDGISVNKSALQTAHLDAGHTYDIIEGIFSVSLGRIAVAADVATILADGTIVWVCGDSTAVTTSTTSTTTTTTTSTTTTIPPTTTTTTTTIPPTTTTTTTTIPPTTTTTTTTIPPTTTTSIGGPTTAATTTTTARTTTTTIGGPCSPTDPECLPNTGGSNLMSVLLAGLGLLFVGVGMVAMADERRRLLAR